MSEYIAQLNAIPSSQDLQSSEDFNLDDDLAMFTNTQFFDFDLGQDADLQPGNFDGRGAQTVAPDNIDMKPMDFNLQGTLYHIMSSYSTHLPGDLLVCSSSSRSSIDAVIAAAFLDHQAP